MTVAPSRTWDESAPMLDRDLVRWCASALGDASAGDEPHPSEENRRADGGGGVVLVGVSSGGEGSASDEPHPSEENRRADERGRREWS